MMNSPWRRLAASIVFATVTAMGLAATAEDGLSVAGEEFDGMLEPSDLVEISSQVPGILDEVAVERGDRVSEGQVLTRLRSGLARIAVELARARVEFARRRMERNEELYLKQLISHYERDELETEVRIAELELAQATERLNMRTLRSPVRGVVVERSKSPGEYVGAEVILTLARIDPLYVEVVVPVAQLGRVRRGMWAEVRPETPVGGSYRGRVIIVDEVVDAASGTFGVRIELPNSDHRLPAGLKCTVRFGGDTAVGSTAR